MVSNNKCCQDLTERIFIGNHNMGGTKYLFSSLHIQLQVQQGWLLPPLPGSARVVGSFFPLGDYCWWLLDHRSICRAACFLSSLFTKCLSLVFIHREEGSHWINHPDLLSVALHDVVDLLELVGEPLLARELVLLQGEDQLLVVLHSIRVELM